MTAGTVLVTYRPQPGQEDALAHLLAGQRALLARLDLVAEPQRTFRSQDAAGRPIFLDLLTWRDLAVTGNPPAEVLRWWGDLQQIVEARDGRPGIEIQQLAPLAD